MVPSPKVATYDLKPEMSAGGVTEVVLDAIERGEDDAIVLELRESRHGGAHGCGERRSPGRRLSWTDASGVFSLRFGASGRGGCGDGGPRQLRDDVGRCENNCPHTAHTLNETPCIVVAPGFEGPLKIRRRALRRGAHPVGIDGRLPIRPK